MDYVLDHINESSPSLRSSIAGILSLSLARIGPLDKSMDQEDVPNVTNFSNFECCVEPDDYEQCISCENCDVAPL